MTNLYKTAATLHFFILFLVLWAYAAMEFGFLGICLGWIPAGIGALALSLFWPLLDLGLLWVVMR